MIDFKNATYVKLSPVEIDSFKNDVKLLLIDGEDVISSFKGMRDYVVFTNKRVISVNVQGITGKKIDYTSLPYKNVVIFSVETAGTFDLDAELDLWFTGLGRVRFEFKGSVDIKTIGKVMSSYVLE